MHKDEGKLQAPPAAAAAAADALSRIIEKIVYLLNMFLGINYRESIWLYK